MKILILFLTSLIVINAFADDRDFARVWTGFMGKKALSEKGLLWQEYQLRYDGNQTTMQQTLFRGGYLQSLSPNHEFGIIAGYIQTNGESSVTKEYRPTIQYSFLPTPLNQLSFSLRNRLEARIIEDNPDFSLRYRSLFRAQYSLLGKTSLVVWDEPFFNLTNDSWTGHRLLERNRFFMGPRFSFETFHFEFGYLNQIVPRKDLTTHEHVLVLYLFY